MNKDKHVFAQLVEFLDTLLIINHLRSFFRPIGLWYHCI